MAKNTLGLVFFPAFDWMISPGHPERQERLLYTRDQLEEEGLFDCEEIKEYRPRLAEIEDYMILKEEHHRFFRNKAFNH